MGRHKEVWDASIFTYGSIYLDTITDTYRLRFTVLLDKDGRMVDVNLSPQEAENFVSLWPELIKRMNEYNAKREAEKATNGN